MNKIMFIGVFVLLIIAISVSAGAPNPGSIWSTSGDCGDAQQDVNHFSIGEAVYINGANFNANTYAWDISGKPGGASCDPNFAVATNSETVDSSGEFCFLAYVVQQDDCGEYTITFGTKKDNYRVSGEEEIPEFGVVAAGLALVGAVAGFAVLRRRD